MITRRTFLLAAPFLALVRPAAAGELKEVAPHPVDLRVFDRDDRDLGLAALAGRLTLLHFWASWCGSCRTEFPALDAFQRDMAADGVKVAAISLDRLGWPSIDATLEKLGIRDLAVFHDRDRAAARDLGVVGLPTTLVVDAKGSEVARIVGAGDWASPDLRRRLLALAG